MMDEGLDRPAPRRSEPAPRSELGGDDEALEHGFLDRARREAVADRAHLALVARELLEQAVDGFVALREHERGDLVRDHGLAGDGVLEVDGARAGPAATH